MQDLEVMNVEELMEVKGGANGSIDDNITISCNGTSAITCNGSPALPK